MTRHRSIKRRKTGRRKSEAGQAMIFLVLALAIFLLASLAFAIDMGNLWFHRQAAQTTADAACTSAAMDMLYTTTGVGSSGGFTAGTSFSCGGTWDTAASTSSPCVYAAKNMGGAASALTAGTQGYDVHFTFPSSFSGLKTCTSGTGSPGICNGPGLTNNFVQVNVDDRAPLFFAGLVSGARTADVGAQATCGVIDANAPIPLLVLNPSLPNTMAGNGNVNVVIVGGPQRSIQVNSTNSGATSVKGASNVVDLSKGGPNDTGSDWGVTANETQAASGYNVSWGSPAGQWLSQKPPISDPFATIQSPPTPTGATPLPPGGGPGPAPGVNGCPASAPANCVEYSAGYYSTGITVGNKVVAIFDPGVYYVGGDASCTAKNTCNFFIDPNGCVRPSTVTGDGSGGAMFYFHGAFSTIQFGNNAGAKCPVDLVTPTQLKCTAASSIPGNITTAGGVSGNVLLGPCQAPTSVTLTNPSKINYGDPLLTNDPIGEQRGLVFFQDRSADLATAKNQPSFGGGGAFGVDGTFYFHYCSSSSGDGTTAQNCTASDFTDQLTLQGTSASSSFVIGDVVVDELNFGGNSGVEMDLNPNALYYVLKASLLQ